MATGLTAENLDHLFRWRIRELQREPEFQLSPDGFKYATGEDGEPSLRVALGNVELDYDLWNRLRNPALVGAYPAGLREIWEFQANRRRQTVDEAGRQTIFQLPRGYDFALHRYGRAVLVSVMLPFSPQILNEYAEIIRERKRGSSHLFSRMFDDVDRMIDKATARVAMDLVVGDAVVVAMDNAAVKGLSAEAVPLTRQGTSHGPCKGGNYPQKSLAVLLGLGQFGVCRIVVRDELVDGRVQRLVGPIKSIVVFDTNELVTDGSGVVLRPSEAWREFVLRLSDFCDVDPDVNRYRFCTYVPSDDEGCVECTRNCPTGAQANSVPANDGTYHARIRGQEHRFWEGKLQFDFARCLDERSQMATLFPEWSCARCLTTCATSGQKRVYAAENWQAKILELTVDEYPRSGHWAGARSAGGTIEEQAPFL